MKQSHVLLLSLTIVLFWGIIGFLVYDNIQLKRSIGKIADQLATIQSSSTPITPESKVITTQSITPTTVQRIAVTPTPQITVTLTPTPKPTTTLTKTEEVTMIRRLLAEFEKYVAVSNTAGALSYFTPPVSEVAKTKLASVRSTNLPYKLTSWGFYVNDDDYLLSDKITGGYRTRMSEWRDGVRTILVIEMVRVDDTYLINRYYKDGATDSGVAESLKYQGF